MQVHIDIAVATDGGGLPSHEQMERWITAALEADASLDEAEISVRIVDDAESQEFNHRYRGKDKPTNVLSFPADLPPELNLPLLGDLVVCAPVVEVEAAEQGKTLEAHWAHMLVHGTLHLLGYDHIDPAEAEVMESLETRILTRLHYPAPYADDGS
ncbi:rRNA maturation RNase YbeY [Marinimicrobium agarilyticum]|uniref:rRNA maturation RNase YbeY n=1 Tax=Marinimicrobium agarilyticum TaxID=306546 RepID=UPI000404F580|nr:rRNA maturation RNase YbeY [Marinimicrobium agarilyticum]